MDEKLGPQYESPKGFQQLAWLEKGRYFGIELQPGIYAQRYLYLIKS
jgi:hypothetical protein